MKLTREASNFKEAERCAKCAMSFAKEIGCNEEQIMREAKYVFKDTMLKRGSTLKDYSDDNTR